MQRCTAGAAKASCKHNTELKKEDWQDKFNSPVANAGK
jgi:hypothetical protein